MRALLVALALCAVSCSPSEPQLWEIHCNRWCEDVQTDGECRTYCDPQELTSEDVSAMIAQGCEGAMSESGCANPRCECMSYAVDESCF